MLAKVDGVESCRVLRAPDEAILVRRRGKACDKTLIAVLAREGFGGRVTKVVPR